MNKTWHVLIADQTNDRAKEIAQILKHEAFQYELACDQPSFLAEAPNADIAIMDRTCLPWLNDHKNLPYLVISEETSMEDAVQIMKDGALDYMARTACAELETRLLAQVKKIRQPEDFEISSARELHEKYQGLISSMTGAYVFLEAQYTADNEFDYFQVLEVNPTFSEALKLCQTSVIGKSFMTILDETDHNLLERLMMTLSSGEPQKFERHLKKTGRLYEFYVYRGLEHRISCVLTDITRHRQAELAFERSDRSYRTLFEHSPIALWVDDYSDVYQFIQDLKGQGIEHLEAYLRDRSEVVRHCLSLVRSLDINMAGISLYGSSSKEELMERPFQIFDDTFLPTFRELLVALASGKTDIQMDGLQKNLQGEPLDLVFRWSVKPIEGRPLARVLLSVLDITHRKRIERDLENQRNFTNAIFDSAGALILVMDRIGRIVRFNNSCEKVSGYSIEQVQGKKLWETGIIAKDEVSEAQRIFKQMRREESTLEEHWVTATGEKRLISWSTTLMERDNRVTHVVAVGQDITEHREAERQAEIQREQLVQADKLASLGTLVAGVAHEINNPNNYIKLNGSILNDFWSGIQPVLDSAREHLGDFKIASMDYEIVKTRVPVLLDAIEDGSNRIKIIVSSLKDFARSDPGNMDEFVNLNDSVDHAVLLSRMEKVVHGFSWKPASSLPPVLGCAQRLEQVLVNILLNASEALPNPRASISVRTGHDTEKSEVFLVVQDEGTGMSTDLIKRIKDPFFTTKRDTGGTGLGLSISDSIIRDHGGRLDFKSAPGEGTTVTISLPVAAIT